MASFAVKPESNIKVMIGEYEKHVHSDLPGITVTFPGNFCSANAGTWRC